MTGPHEIKDASSNVVNPTHTQGPRPSSPLPTDSQQHMPDEDSVNLSPISQELEAIQKEISLLPEIREERVNHIRQALNSGTYRISSEQIADRIIQETVRNSPHPPE